jgi:chromosome segregation ATPase
VRSGANGTPISARASVRKPATSSTVTAARSARDIADEDARAETINLIDDLKAQLQKTEEASSEYEKQVQMLQSRLDDAVKEQGKLEERLHEEEERIEGLENDKRESIRQKRELDTIYEAERAAVIKDKEATHVREEELQAIIQRLKESLAQKESRPGMADDGRLSRTGTQDLLCQ